MGVRLVALVPLVGLLLAGCSSSGAGEEPLPQPPPFSAGPTPTPTRTPTAVAIEVPASARATNAVGAAQFTRFYLEVLGEAFNTGDTTGLRALSDPACGGCNNFIALTRSEQKAGKRYEGGKFLVRTAEATDDATGAVVDVTYRRAASRTFNSAGDLLKESPGADEDILQARVLRTASGWSMRGIRFPERS